MKKLIALLLCLVMALSLVACGSKQDDTQAPADDQQGAEETSLVDAAKAEGKPAFTLDSKQPKPGYRDFIMGEARYSALTRSFPERAEELFQKAEESALARYEHLTKVGDLYNK